MVKYRYLTLFIFLSSLLSNVLFGAHYSVALELSDIHYIKNQKGQIEPTIFMGDSFKLKLIVSGKKSSPNKIKIKGLKNFQQLGESHHSNMSITNSDVSIEKETTYTLAPKEEGTFTIGPAKLNQNGATMVSNEVTVRVAKQSQRPHLKYASNLKTEETEKRTDDDAELFCTLTANKNSAVIEEPIEITLEIYRRGNISNIRLLQKPNFHDCTVKEIKQTKEYKKDIKGKTYSVIEKKFIVFPGVPGSLNISPIQTVYHVRKKKRKKAGLGFFDDEFFAGFFNSQLEQKIAASNPLKLQISELPQSDKKSDGIGTFSSFQATTNKIDVSVNEPITLTLALNGKANFDLILQPKLNLPSIFKSYDSKTTNRENKKIFEFILQIPQAGNWTIPSQLFTYFDINEKKYKTIQTDPIEIHASIPEGEESAPIVPTEEQKDIIQKQQKPIATDIHFIQEDASPTRQKQRKFSILFFLLLLLIIPCIIFMKKFSSLFSPIYKHFFASKNIFSKYQTKLDNIIKSNKPEKCYNLFIRFLAESYRVPVAHVREEWIKGQLAQNGIREKEINAFITFLNECAQYSFASKKMRNTDLEQFAEQAHYWMNLIKKS